MKTSFIFVWALVPCAALAQTGVFGFSVEKVTSLNKRVETIAFSPDGNFLAAGTSDGQVAYRDLASHSDFRQLDSMASRVVGLSFTEDGRFLVAAAEAGTVVVISIATSPSVERRIQLHRKIRALATSPRNDWAAVETVDNHITVFDLKTGSELYILAHGPTKTFEVLGFARNGDSLVGVGGGGALWDWDVSTRRLARSWQDEDNSIHAAARSANTSLLAVSTEFTAMNKGALRNGASGGQPGNFGPALGRGGRGGFGSLGQADTNGLYRQNKLKVWDLREGRIVKTLDGMDGVITALSISVDDRFIASVRQKIKDSYLDVFDIQRGVATVSIPIPGSGTAVSFSGDARWLASANDRGQVAVYSVTGVLRGQTGEAFSDARIQITSKDTFPLISPGQEYALAIMDFDTALADKELGRAVAELLRNRISGAEKVKLVERGKFENLLKEQNIQFSDRIDADKAVKLGRMLGAQKMIFGEVSRFDTTYTIDVRLVDVQTGRQDGVREVICQRCGQVDLPGAVAVLKTALVNR